MYAPWTIGGILLGFVFFVAVLLVQPIGVSTEFVVADAIVWDALDGTAITAEPTAATGYTSPNAYLAEGGGRHAAEAAEPLNYGLVFAFALMIGALLSAIVRGGVGARERTMPSVWRTRFGGSRVKRWITAFAAGAIVLYGARLAGGCTSGHLMSGTMQTALSGFLFMIAACATAFPTATAIYRRER